MIEDILSLLQGDWLPAGSVGAGDMPGAESVSTGDMPGAESVSAGDFGNGINYYQVNLYTLPGDPAGDILDSESQEIQYTLWDKPLEDYSVSDGLLLILVLIAWVLLVLKLVEGGFKWLK